MHSARPFAPEGAGAHEEVVMKEAEAAFASPVSGGLLDLVHAATAAGVEAILSRDQDQASARASDLLWLLGRALARGRPEVATAGARGLGAVYATPEATDDLRLELAVGVSALGGLAVRLRAWRLVHELAMLQSGGSEQPYLVPDALLRAARRSASRTPDEPLIGLAVKWAANHAEARPELPASDDRVLNSACQFNVFATVAQFRTGSKFGFPEFRRYEARRSDPAFEVLVADIGARSDLLPGADNRRLASLIREVSTVHREWFVQFGVWGGPESRSVAAFLEANREG